MDDWCSLVPFNSHRGSTIQIAIPRSRMSLQDYGVFWLVDIKGPWTSGYSQNIINAVAHIWRLKAICHKGQSVTSFWDRTADKEPGGLAAIPCNTIRWHIWNHDLLLHSGTTGPAGKCQQTTLLLCIYLLYTSITCDAVFRWCLVLVFFFNFPSDIVQTKVMLEIWGNNT